MKPVKFLLFFLLAAGIVVGDDPESSGPTLFVGDYGFEPQTLCL
jgi:hypothetical protein